MKLIGNLKKKVENAKTKEEARDTIKKAGMLLDDDELAQVSGGANTIGDNREFVDVNSKCEESENGKHVWGDFSRPICRCKLCGKYTSSSSFLQPKHGELFSL